LDWQISGIIVAMSACRLILSIPAQARYMDCQVVQIRWRDRVGRQARREIRSARIFRLDISLIHSLLRGPLF